MENKLEKPNKIRQNPIKVNHIHEKPQEMQGRSSCCIGQKIARHIVEKRRMVLLIRPFSHFIEKPPETERTWMGVLFFFC